MGDFNAMDSCYELHLAVDRTVKLRKPISGWAKARYEDWLDGNARSRAFRARAEGYLDAREFQESLAATIAESAALTFAWGGKAWESSLQQVPGLAKLISILATDADRKFNITPPQKLDPYEVVLAMSSNPDVSAMIGSAIQEVLHSSPNFMCPPMPGTVD